MFSRKDLLKILGNSIFGLVLILLWLKLINLDQIWQFLKKAQISYLGFFFIFFVVSTSLRALRLKIFLKKWQFSFKDLLFLNFLSQFLSFIVPIRAGEIAKGIYLSKKDLSFAKSLVLILLDRFFDFWMTIVIVCILLTKIPNNLPRQTETILLLAIAALTIAAFLAAKMRKVFLQITNFIEKLLFFKRVQKIFKSLSLQILESFENLNRPLSEILAMILLSALASFSDAIIWMFIFLSLGTHLGYPKALLGGMLDTLTFLVPAAPGYVGSIEAGTVAVWSGALGLSTQLSSSVAIAFHLLNLIAIPIFGLVAIYALKFNLNLLWQKFRKE